MITNFVQRWAGGRPTYRPAREPLDPKLYDVAEIPEAAAKDFVITNHYSGTYPAARRRFGLFDRQGLAGVAVFSHPCNERTITNVFNCDRASDGLELGRFVLLDRVPANGETWFLARCRSALRGDYVGVVSFADDVPRRSIDGRVLFAGHVGTIYQASNASFLGRGSSGKLRVLPDGRILSKRAISKLRSGETGVEYVSRILEASGAPAMPEGDASRRAWADLWISRLTRPIDHPGNLKYAWSFSRSVKLSGLQYPKFTASYRGGTL